MLEKSYGKVEHLQPVGVTGSSLSKVSVAKVDQKSLRGWNPSAPWEVECDTIKSATFDPVF